MFTTLPGRSDRASLHVDGSVAEGECPVLIGVYGTQLGAYGIALYLTRLKP